MSALLELCHIIADAVAASACVTFDIRVVAKGSDGLLNLRHELVCWGKNKNLRTLDIHIELLKNQNGEGCGIPNV